MRKTVILLIAFMLSLAIWMAACSPAPKPGPKEFKSEAGRFSVMSPRVLKETTQSIDTPAAGKITFYVFLGEQGNEEFAVSYGDYPETIIKKIDPQIILDGARNGMVRNINGKLISETKIALEGNPGRELLIDVLAGGGREITFKARLFLVKNRLYQIMWVAPKGKASVVEMDAFLQSLKLLKN